MRRLFCFLLISCAVVTPIRSLRAAQSDNANAIFFYRLNDKKDSNQSPTIYEIFTAETRPLATIQKGEYFGINITTTPGVHLFSWTAAPSRREIVSIDVPRGSNAFVRVQFRDMTVTSLETAVVEMEGLRPIGRERALSAMVPLQIFHFPPPTPTPPTVAVATSENQNATPTSPPSSTPPATVPTTTAKTSSATDQLKSQPQVRETPAQQQSRSEQTNVPQSRPVAAAKGKEIKIHGYVTAITSPTVFEIEDYRITRDTEFVLDFENQGSDVHFNIADVRVGTELEIKGTFYEATGELRAKSAKIDLEQFRKLKDTAVIGHAPVGLTKGVQGWSGVFLSNGQRIQVSPETKVVFKLTKAEQKAEKAAQKGKDTRDEDKESELHPLTSLEDIKPGMYMTYEGRRDIETGMIAADSVEFSKNEFDKGEKQLWDQFKTKIKPSNTLTLQPGDLTIGPVGKFKLVPNDEVQEYVTKIGRSLIPDYVREMPDSDPAKPQFKFFVVINKEPNAFAVANGIFVIHSGMFDVAENEAQLAAVIGHEIAHATQEHTWRQMQYHKTALTLLHIGSAVAAGLGNPNVQAVGNIGQLVEAGIRSGYSRNLENQADRVGLEYMVSAGYDPREAPKLWKAMTKATGLEATNFFYSRHDNHATRRSYLMNEIRNNHSDLDYSKTRSEETTFKRMANLVKESASGKKKIKVK